MPDGAPRERVDVLVVGAGLSGLALAHLFVREMTSEKKSAGNGGRRRVLPAKTEDEDEDESDVVRLAVLEARPRLGGRLLATDSGVDLGAAWTWPSNDKRLGALMDDLDVKSFVQAKPGDAVILLRDGQVGTRPDRQGDGRMRMHGGAASIAAAAAKGLPEDVLRLSSPVTAISRRSDGVEVEFTPAVGSATGRIWAKRVVVALPPKVALATIRFDPPLSEEKAAAMAQTPTWMESTIKVAVEYSRPWWRDAGLSGSGFAPGGLVGELWDNTGEDGTSAALCGFILGDAAEDVALLEDVQLRELVLAQFDRMFGSSKHRDAVTRFSAGRWIADVPFTRTVGELRDEFEFMGASVLRQPHGPSVFFAGTETENEYGHMEGAVRAAERVLDEILPLEK